MRKFTAWLWKQKALLFWRIPVAVLVTAIALFLADIREQQALILSNQARILSAVNKITPYKVAEIEQMKQDIALNRALIMQNRKFLFDHLKTSEDQFKAINARMYEANNYIKQMLSWWRRGRK